MISSSNPTVRTSPFPSSLPFPIFTLLKSLFTTKNSSKNSSEAALPDRFGAIQQDNSHGSAGVFQYKQNQFRRRTEQTGAVVYKIQYSESMGVHYDRIAGGASRKDTDSQAIHQTGVDLPDAE